MELFNNTDLVSIREASLWASTYINKNVTESNISYLIQYGRIKKHGENGNVFISQHELKHYYDSYYGKREINWKDKLGDDLNWHLSFDKYKEADTTKHVHRLHPYKGKFIPQLVEYFLDSHTDEFKREIYFNKDDIILDPFCGSGTALVQASELGMHAVGIDISAFNALMSNVKIGKYNFQDIYNEIHKVTTALKHFIVDSNTVKFEARLAEELWKFNTTYFPSHEFKYKVKKKEIDEDKYGEEKAKVFLPVYEKLVKEYNIQLRQEQSDTFLSKWFLQHVRSEIDFLFNIIKDVQNQSTKKTLTIILSRTIRSCRATKHADLATLKEPITTTYFCAKHGKICKPLFSILSWWERYSKDTLFRLQQFNKLRTDTFQYCLTGDSRAINLIEELKNKRLEFGKLIEDKNIKGIFSSPPYVGLINYHEQHAYAYDLFHFDRNDELEIGPLYKGSGREAKESYVKGISEVLLNCKKYLADDFHVFLVANDKHNLYPAIAENSGMKIVNQFKRPVLNRTEKDKGAYSEIIFHLKK